jgi:hypothetical protein
MPENIEFELKENLVSAKYAERLKRFLGLSSLVISVLILFVLVLVFFIAKKNEPVIKKEAMCTSHACIKAGINSK